VFSDGYRIVDFVLSNLVNSGIEAIYVLAQYKPQSLVQHIDATWAPLLRDERASSGRLSRTPEAARRTVAPRMQYSRISG
jgi:ADP-glucose pyrophosphorylase